MLGIRCCDQFGASGIHPICHFAAKNDGETVRVLLLNGADVNAGVDFAAGDPTYSAEAPFTDIEDVGTSCWYIPEHAYRGLQVKMEIVEVSQFQGVRVTSANLNAELSPSSAGVGFAGSVDGGLRTFWVEGFKLTRADPYAGSRNIFAVGDRVLWRNRRHVRYGKLRDRFWPFVTRYLSLQYSARAAWCALRVALGALCLLQGWRVGCSLVLNPMLCPIQDDKGDHVRHASGAALFDR